MDWLAFDWLSSKLDLFRFSSENCFCFFVRK